MMMWCEKKLTTNLLAYIRIVFNHISYFSFNKLINIEMCIPQILFLIHITSNYPNIEINKTVNLHLGFWIYCTKPFNVVIPIQARI